MTGWLWVPESENRPHTVGHVPRWSSSPLLTVVLQSAARRRGDRTEERSQARVRRRNEELLLRGGLHLREHRERAVLLYFAGRCRKHTHTQRYMYECTIDSSPSFSHWLQERQSIIKFWLDNLRAKHGEVLHNINFLEGQPISEFFYFIIYSETYVELL